MDLNAALQALDDCCAQLDCAVRKMEPMSAHTTFRIGGPCDRFICVNNQEQLAAVLRRCSQVQIPVLVLGNGSNLLVSDKGIRGAVVVPDGEFKSIALQDETTLCAGSAVPLSRLCVFAKEQGLSGLEFAYGIPGTCGGAAYMNAGAYGGEMKDVLQSCDHLSFTGEAGNYAKEQLQLSYRHSVYQQQQKAITFLHLQLCPAPPQAVAAKMEDLLQRRKDKQPLDYPSAGSIFKRPQNGYAAALIEQCGLKGLCVGGAQVSVKHAGFIVNTGGATCEDVRRLIESIRQTVFAQTGTALECEVKVTGEL